MLAHNAGVCIANPYKDVALVLVVVKRAIVDHVACPGPGVGQQVLDKVLPFSKVCHGPVLQHSPTFVVTIHGPHLRGDKGLVKVGNI